MKSVWKIFGVVAVLLVAASGLLYLDSTQEPSVETSGQSEAGAQNPIWTEVEARNAVQTEVEVEAQNGTGQIPPGETQLINGNATLATSDFIGYSSLGSVNRTLVDVPVESRQSFEEFGFKYSTETRLQKPLLGENEVPDNDFRELQSTVFIFSNASGANGFFDKLVQNFNKTFEVVKMEVGEEGVAYIDTFASGELGVEVEQQFLYFLEKNAVGSVSVTGLETANMTADLLLEAAHKLEEKMH